MIEIVKVASTLVPDTCPYCESRDVYINDSTGSDYGLRLYLPMHCDSCDKDYQAMYDFKFSEGYAD